MNRMRIEFYFTLFGLQKTLYSAEMSKVKAKHEVELLELRNDLQRYVDKIEQYETRFQQLSNQLYAKNEQHLHLLKENEIMKSKMRTLENHTAFPSMKPAQLNVPTSFIDKIRGKWEENLVEKYSGIASNS